MFLVLERVAALLQPTLLLPSVLTPWLLQQHIQSVHALSKTSSVAPQSIFLTRHTMLASLLRWCTSEVAFSALDGAVLCIEWLWYGKEGRAPHKEQLRRRAKKASIVDCCLMQICNPTSLFAGMFVLRSYTSPYRVLSVRLSTACCWSHVFSITHFERLFEIWHLGIICVIACTCL